MEKDSNLKDCWEETDDFVAWKAGVQALHSRLQDEGAKQID